MKKLFLSCIVALAAVTSSATDTYSLRVLFKQMPDSVIPYLSTNNRLDFLDFMDSQMKAEVTNNFGGKSQMTLLTDTLITIRLNEACTVDLLLLETEGSPIDSCNCVIALVRTIGLESEIKETDTPEFYSVKWQRLESRPVLAATDLERLTKRIKQSNILNYLDNILNKD